MLSKKCRLLTCEIITLVIIGIVMIASSSRVWAEAKFEDPMYFMKRQLVFAIIGCFVMAGAAKIDLMKIRPHIKKIFLLCRRLSFSTDTWSRCGTKRQPQLVWSR